MSLAEVMALDGVSGWGDHRRCRPGTAVPSCGAGVALPVRWLMGHLDTMVASGQYGYYEEGDAIVVRQHE